MLNLAFEGLFEGDIEGEQVAGFIDLRATAEGKYVEE